MKRCTHSNCEFKGQLQPLENFNKRSSKKDGLNSHCKSCVARQNKSWESRNVDKRIEYDLKHKGTQRELVKKWKHSFAKFELFKDQISTFEEIRQDPNNIELIQVKCATCQNWFNPTVSSLHNRIGAINGTRPGENHLYCSKECKSTCPVYRQKLVRKDSTDYTERNQREMQGELRELVLTRDNNVCQKCGNYGYICHHILSLNDSPVESADVDNCITVCSQCHEDIHSKKGCRRVDLTCESRT